MRLVTTLVLAALTIGGATGRTSHGAASGAGSPLTRHVNAFPGGLSAGMRAFVLHTHAVEATVARVPPIQRPFGPNIQMNRDPQHRPQTETAVALDLTNPMVAVASAQDGFSGTAVLMRTTNGGKSWTTSVLEAEFEGARCSCCDSSLAYSLRDRAFYLG